MIYFKTAILKFNVILFPSHERNQILFTCSMVAVPGAKCTCMKMCGQYSLWSSTIRE